MQIVQTSDEFGISPVQYARIRGLSLNWVYALIWTGALPAKKMFGRWFIAPDAIPERSKRVLNETVKDNGASADADDKVVEVARA